MALIAPHIANGIVIMINCKLINQLAKQANEKIKEGSFKILNLLHHITAGMKSITTEMQYIANDELRQACGGAGYTLASGIAYHFLANSPLPTFEGVNVLMLQQSARPLLKVIGDIEKGKK